MKKSASFIVITTFISAIFLGAILLSLPISTTSGSISPADALFTATSAVTVTGLIVEDTPTYFTFFGQMVILILFQFGGVGFMTFSTLMILLIGKSISLQDKFIIENDFTAGGYKNLKDLVKKIFLLTFGLEFLGAVVLYFQFSDLDPNKRLFSSVFHSISAFCNAGFSTFSNSFENYADNTGVNITLILLIILGGIGFLVLNDVYMFFTGKIRKFSRFSLHTKLVLISSGLLVVLGFAVILGEELIHKGGDLPLGKQILTALFQSVSARTAGFNTMDLGTLTTGSIYIMIILMTIGASPGSTGGGVKTSSISIAVAYVRARLRNNKKVDLFYRNIPSHTIEKAFLVIIISFIVITVSFLFIASFEEDFKLSELLFETVSAFGTVGLSMGITAKLSMGSRIVLMITMFIGRIGPLTLLLALSRRESRGTYNYPEENIMIG